MPSFYPVSVVRAPLLWDVVEMRQSGPNGMEVSGPKIMSRGFYSNSACQQPRLFLNLLCSTVHKITTFPKTQYDPRILGTVSCMNCSIQYSTVQYSTGCPHFKPPSVPLSTVVVLGSTILPNVQVPQITWWLSLGVVRHFN